MLKTSAASFKRSLWLLVAAIIVISVGRAQTPVPYAKLPKHQGPVYKSRLPGVLVTRMWDWTTEAWNGDDTPYHQARLDINKVADTKQGLDELLIKYKAQAQRNPDDALTAFRWAYTAYQVMLNRYSTRAQHKALDGVEEALRQADSPHTYDYACIRFLVSEFYTPYRQAVPIAKRLLVVDSNDYEVEYSLASIYINAYVSPPFEEALAICHHLKQLYPTRSSIYTLTGETYVLWWYKDKNPAYAQAAVENYEKYLQLAPPNDEFRKRAQGIISQMKAR